MAKVENTPENFKICMQGNCNNCPSYPKIEKEGEGLYCARGASTTTIEKRGCNCPECPVWVNNGLTGMYYCIKGRAT